jgi:hypothetical protein
MAPVPNDQPARRAAETLRFVNRRTDAPRHSPGVVIVLDPAWTPDPASPDAAIPIRPALTAVLDDENLFLTSVARLDTWAEPCDMVNRFSKDGVTWWFHARSFLRLDLQEMLLWGRLLDRMVPSMPYRTIVVPQDRPLLEAAIRADPGAADIEIRTESGSAFASSDASGKPPTGPVQADRPRRLRRRPDGWRHAWPSHCGSDPGPWTGRPCFSSDSTALRRVRGRSWRWSGRSRSIPSRRMAG